MDTSQKIIEKVAPIFNKKGYVGTSLSEITKEIQLTKGAIYCNFKNKEELALKAFKFNIGLVIRPLKEAVLKADTNHAKLNAIIEYYRGYYTFSEKIGGCPVLKVGNDSKYNNPKLFDEATAVSKRLILGLEVILSDGMKSGEFSSSMNAQKMARNIYSMIEGGIFMAITLEDETFLTDILDFIDQKMLQEILM